MLILKKINNNVALAASDDGREVVVFGKGIGFHDMPYELSDESLIQRKFYNVPESLQDMVGTLPDDVLLAASDIACFASRQLGCKLSGGLPFILAITCNLPSSATTTSSAHPTRSSTRSLSSTRASFRSVRQRSPSCKSIPVRRSAKTRPRASHSISLTPRSTAWAVPRTWTSS